MMMTTLSPAVWIGLSIALAITNLATLAYYNKNSHPTNDVIHSHTNHSDNHMNTTTNTTTTNTNTSNDDDDSDKTQKQQKNNTCHENDNAMKKDYVPQWMITRKDNNKNASDSFRIKYTFDEQVSLQCKFQVICQDAIQWLQQCVTTPTTITTPTTSHADTTPDTTTSHTDTNDTVDNGDESNTNNSSDDDRMIWKEGSFVVTSLPDYSEIGMNVEEWKIWFMNAVSLILEKLPEGSCAIFYQTDVKLLTKKVFMEEKTWKKQKKNNTDNRKGSDELDSQETRGENSNASLTTRTEEEGEAGSVDANVGNNKEKSYQKPVTRSLCTEWIDKSRLCFLGAEKVPNVKVLWHKMMLRAPVGTVLMGHPGYSHMICFGKGNNVSDNISRRPLPDILDRGDMLYPKAMGINACMLAMIFCKEAGATTIIDPFCGKGSVLLAANYVGLDAIGVDISATRCRNAKSMRHNSMKDFVKCVQTRSFMRLQ